MAYRNLSLLLTLLLAACGGATRTNDPVAEPPAASDPIAEALAGSHRSEENRARDAHRHPHETLTFFGLRPDMTVVEMSPGGGWYTEVLAPVLRENGRLIAAAPDPSTEYGQRFTAFIEANPTMYDRVERVTFAPPDQLSLGPDGSADMVLTFRSVHGWVNRGHAEQVFGAMFRVLKPGGVLGIEQHRGPDGVDPETGYVAESQVIALAEAAGFVLEERSEINANPADDHDHPEGVWTLPPTLRLGDQDRAAYEAIGETDRMTLRFRKPAS